MEQILRGRAVGVSNKIADEVDSVTTNSAVNSSEASRSELSGSELSGSELSGSELNGSQFNGSELSGSEFSSSGKPNPSATGTGQFLGRFGHELRNPLNAISSALQMTARKPTLEVHTWATGLIERQLTALTKLADELHDVSAVLQGKLKLQSSHVRLSDLIEGAKRNVETLFAERGVNLLTHTVSSSPGDGFEGDAKRIGEILTELLSNAAKHSDAGSEVTFSTQLSPEDVRFFVHDHGSGLTPERIQSLFQLFAPRDPESGTSRAGLGIGLPLCQAIANLHGGRVEVKSDGLGAGSCFTLVIPNAANPALG